MNIMKKDIKTEYKDKVLLTQEEYKELIDTYGKDTTNNLLEELSRYKKWSNKEYTSDYRAILKWVVKKVTGNDNNIKSKLNSDQSKK